MYLEDLKQHVSIKINLTNIETHKDLINEARELAEHKHLEGELRFQKYTKIDN